MAWVVLFDVDFAEKFARLGLEVQIGLRAHLVPLQHLGPQLGRPLVDTLKGSKHANMKELRFKAGNGVWRVAFVFDPSRAAILLVAGDKAGVAEKRFYKQLIAIADLRIDVHLKQ
jgi:hypothetical protein